MDENSMEYDGKYQITLEFPSVKKLQVFWSVFEEFILKKQPKNHVKKENDQRGSHVGEIHRLTRELLKINPELPYRVAYKIMADDMKQKRANVPNVSNVEINIT